MATPELPHVLANDHANVVRLQPLRVVISGRDRRYVRVTSFLLVRKGYEVAVAAPDDVVLVAQRKRADVVLVEDAESRAASAAAISALLALPSSPSVVIVSEDGRNGRWKGLRTIEKWTPLEALVAVLESAVRNRSVEYADGDRSR